MSDNSQALLKRRKAQLEKKNTKRPLSSSASSAYNYSDTDTSIYSIKSNTSNRNNDQQTRITSDSSSNRCYRITNTDEVKFPDLTRPKSLRQLEQEQKLEKLKQLSAAPVLDADCFDVNYKLSDYDEEAEKRAALELKEKREAEERQRRLAEEDRVRMEELRHKRALEESKRKRAELERVRLEAERRQLEEAERQRVAILDRNRIEMEERKKREEEKRRRAEEEERMRAEVIARLEREEEERMREETAAKEKLEEENRRMEEEVRFKKAVERDERRRAEREAKKNGEKIGAKEAPNSGKEVKAIRQREPSTMTPEQQRHILILKNDTKKISEQLLAEQRRLEAERTAMLKAQEELLAKLLLEATKKKINESEDEDEDVPVKTVVKQLTKWGDDAPGLDSKNVSASSDRQPFTAAATITKSIKKYRF